MSLLTAESLSFGFGQRRLVDNLSFKLAPQELLLVSGPNGAGKSSLLQVVLGFPPAQVFSGKLELLVTSSEIAWIPQMENPEFHLPLTLRDVLDISVNRRLELKEVLDFGLLREEHLKHSWNQASGGERKRTLITRALLHHPRLLLLDEPLNHLDVESRTVVTQGLSKYLASGRGAAIVVSHDALSGQELSLFKRHELYIEPGKFTLESHL